MIKVSGTTSDLLEIEINKLFLRKNGIDIRIDTTKDNNIYVVINENILKQKINRGGRYDKTTTNDLKIGEVFELRKNITDREIYLESGISKSTFYRRLKKAQKLIDDIGFEEAKNYHF